MLMQKQNNNNKKKKGLRRSQILLFGSLLVFVGFVTLSYGHFSVLKELIYENVRLSILMNDTSKKKKEKKEEPIVVPAEPQPSNEPEVKEEKPKVYYNYIGYLEIPKIRLKRGFVDKNSKYNNIQYNVTISNVSNMPDVDNGNFILYAHSLSANLPILGCGACVSLPVWSPPVGGITFFCTATSQHLWNLT